MAVAPKVVTEGVSKWSVNPDDNATADERINWQEGMMPGVVNNSARMVMARIKEQYLLDQAQFKSITDAVNSKFGNKIKDIVADSYTITKESTPGHWTINFIFNDQVTLAEYNDYKAQKLYFLTRLLAANISSNSIYQTWTYNSIIAINLTFVINGTQYVNNMEFYLNFFGIDKYNNVITLHELKHFVNCTTLQRGNGGLTTNLISLPMKRTYSGSKNFPPHAIDPSDATVESNVEWHYISPVQCILVHKLKYLSGAPIAMDFPLPVPKTNCLALRFNNFTNNERFSLIITDSGGGLPKIPVINYGSVTGRDPIYPDGYFTFMMTGTPAELTDYPMILTPTTRNTYPITV